MDKILITFCVPCYNSAAYMSHAIDSLLTKKDEGIEIVIVNDGSKDDTGKIADEYASKYPGVCIAHHQENGGHGEGINSALRLARGEYFKVVDSDDWVDQEGYTMLIDAIKSGVCPDMFMMNYTYYVNGEPRTEIKFKKAFPRNKLITWNEVGKFKKQENLTLHSVCYKTEVIRKSGIVLPKKIAYEDNYFIYSPLRFVETIYYIDHTLYCYFIGREGQTVSKETCLRKYKEHLEIARLLFFEFNVLDYKKNKKKYKTMLHHLCVIEAIGTLYTRLVKDERKKQAKKDFKEFRKACKEHDKKQYNKLWHGTYLFWLTWPTWLGGRIFIQFIFWLAHKVVPFY